MSKHKRLTDAYRFPGFIPSQIVKGVFGDPKARVIILQRRQKKQYAPSVVKHNGVFMTVSNAVFATFRVATRGCFWNWRFDASTVGVAAR